MRYFLEIAYQGTHYHGWQLQPNAHTVQAALNQALQILLKHPVETLASGRTDTGVHASQQFVHLDAEEPLTARHLRPLNALLPHDIAVKAIHPVTDSAHARFDAISRSYEYRISRVKNPFLRNLCYTYTSALDLAAMNEAARQLVTYEDFTSFSRVKTDVNHFRCTVHEAYWEEMDELLIFHIRANRFLRGMVRAIVGTLLEVGKGRLTVDGFRQIIDAQDRKAAGSAAPPEGLFLTGIRYPYPLQ